MMMVLSLIKPAMRGHLTYEATFLWSNRLSVIYFGTILKSLLEGGGFKVGTKNFPFIGEMPRFCQSSGGGGGALRFRQILIIKTPTKIA